MTRFPRIIFDVDNVLADSMSVFCQKASEMLGFKVDKQNIRNHKVIGSIPLTSRTIFRLQSEVWADWKRLAPLEGDLQNKMEAFHMIGFTIYIATAIPLRLTSYVKQWLKKAQIPYDKFFHCSQEYSKSKIDAEALVDDAPEEVQSFIRSGRQGFLYSQPWNFTAKIPGAIRVRNIDHVLKFYGVEKAKGGAYRDIRWLGENRT